MSGRLSFTKDNKVHSMFIGTKNLEFIFLPTIYIHFLIYQIEKKRKDVGINFINLECKINENNKLECLEDYQGLNKGDVIYKTRFYPDSGNYTCNCPGTWRAKDRMCKHIIKLKSEIENGERK